MTIPAVRHKIIIALLCALSLLAACGKAARDAALDEHHPSSPPPSVAELRAKLDSELAKLGKDVSHVVSVFVSPDGNENRVVDLDAIPLDFSAPARAIIPQGVLLEWTERMVGDYDQNGLVAVADLTPLANVKFWDHAVAYVDPRGEGAKWPSGDGVVPAEPYDPIWRVARVDGDTNGLVALADISPIAKHWLQMITGYHVYRKGAADIDYVALPGDVFKSITPEISQGTLSIPRAAANAPGGDAPEPDFGVHYVFFDQSLPGPGEYEYVVAPTPYPAPENHEGPKSFAFTVTYPGDPQLPADPGTGPPTVTLSSTAPQVDNAPFEVQFEAEAVSPTSVIESVFWDFDSDGTIDEATGRQMSVKHTYETPGHPRASVYVVEPGGRSASAQLDIDVKDNGNSLPVANLIATPPAGDAPLQVTLDASGSTDTEGIAMFEFDPKGIGTFVTGAGPTLEFTYTEGEYDAVVRVTDTNGKADTATTHISVGPVDNDPPVLTITNLMPPGAYAPENIQFQFTTDDPEDHPMTLDIDWENDGVIDESQTVVDGDTFRWHIYDDFGSHTLRAVLTDEWNATDEETNTFALLENHPPTATLSADVTNGPAPLTVNFTAGGTDPDAGQTLSYYWDFRGTGNFAGPFTAQESFTYYEYGLRGAWVRVKDDNGAYDDAEVDINTTTGWEYQYITGPYDGSFPPGKPEVTVALVDGNPAVAYVRGGTLYYARSDNPEGSSWTSAVSLDTPGWGAIEPSLSVINGVPAIAYLSADGDCRYIYAVDADGAGWNPPVLVDNISGQGAACDLQLVNGNPAIAWVDSLSHLRYIRASTPSGDLWPAVPVDLSANGTYIFSQEIELKVVAGLPAIAACNATDLHYFYALDADGTLWNLPMTVFSGTLRYAAGMDVVPGVPDLPVIAFWQSDGLYATTGNDPAGLSWTTPVLVAAGSPPANFVAPEVELARVAGAFATMPEAPDFHTSDSLGTSWNPKSGIFDQGIGLESYDITDAAGKPFVAIEDNNGLAVCWTH